MTVQRMGGTVVVMEKFDPETCLALIEKHRADTAQFVPTHFVRMLKLPPDVRARYDVSSMRSAVHAAAPCPMQVKEEMLAWWGPVIYEYYAGTEGNGFTYIGPQDWLTHKGSVGRAVVGETRICGDDGEELPPRSRRRLFRQRPRAFYHNDPGKAAENTNRHGWTTLGDVGWVDEKGYLYLTDRKSFMIISGGVNIHPQEIENLLVTHPRSPTSPSSARRRNGRESRRRHRTSELGGRRRRPTRRTLAFARANLSHVKAPRALDFMAELPRHPTGKLYKRLIRDALGQEGQPHRVSAQRASSAPGYHLGFAASRAWIRAVACTGASSSGRSGAGGLHLHGSAR